MQDHYNTNAPLCECGCGCPVQWNPRKRQWNRFINYHSNRGVHSPRAHLVTLEQRLAKRHYSQEIPSGVCQCGCGQPTPVSNYTDISTNRIKGYASLFVPGHALRGRVMSKKTHPSDTELSNLLWSRVDKTDTCWLWSSPKTRAGYGVLCICRTKLYVHRLAWELTYGPISDGMEVCHHCDTPNCVNPEHLFLGTHADNIRDAHRKGRLNLTGLVLGAKARWSSPSDV